MVKGLPKAAHEDKSMNSKIRSVADAESDIKSNEDSWPQVCEAVTKGERMSSMLETDEGKVPGLPEDLPHERFATKIRHATGETYECDREFERKHRTNVCNSADVED